MPPRAVIGNQSGSRDYVFLVDFDSQCNRAHAACQAVGSPVVWPITFGRDPRLKIWRDMYISELQLRRGDVACGPSLHGRQDEQSGRLVQTRTGVATRTKDAIACFEVVDGQSGFSNVLPIVSNHGCGSLGFGRVRSVSLVPSNNVCEGNPSLGVGHRALEGRNQMRCCALSVQAK